MLVVLAQLEALPLPESQGAPPQVDQHVDDLAPRAANQLRQARLKVHPADHSTPRPRVIVLDEFVLDPKAGQLVAAIGLEKEPPRIAVHHRLDQDRAFKRGRKPHAARTLASGPGSEAGGF